MLLLNKYVIYSIIALLIFTGAAAYVYEWEASIKREATLQFNNAQLQKTLEDQQKYDADLKSVNDNQKNIINDITKQNEDLQANLANLNNYLNSNQAIKDNKGSSEVLKRTLKGIGAE